MKLNMQSMLQQAQRMQEEMEKMKHELSKKIVTTDAGGGMVSVTMTGGNEVISVKISKEIVDQNDVEMLEDLIVAAVNKAIKAANEMINEEMGKVTSMLPNIPGLNLNL